MLSPTRSDARMLRGKTATAFSPASAKMHDILLFFASQIEQSSFQDTLASSENYLQMLPACAS